MKRNINVIQINGIRGLVMAAFAVICLFVGFIIFPGKVWMCLWNYTSNYFNSMPMIGIFQGVLLWCIIVASYFIFRKNRLVVCFKSPNGLSDEELKSVYESVKKQSMEDPIIQAMQKARELELQQKNTEENVPSQKDENNNVVSDESETKIG